jgi:alkanesulfonate monooxygenase SsuD/methylene tetrahydromethanopterin reductase-like flavin-dependent oxidoreductase (luciferase family)
MMRVAARYADAYNTVVSTDPESVAGPLAMLDAACEDVGRDPSTIRKTIGTFVAYPGSEDDPGGIHANALVGTPDEVAERFHALHEAGVEHITMFASPWGLRAVEQTGQMIARLRELGS